MESHGAGRCLVHIGHKAFDCQEENPAAEARLERRTVQGDPECPKDSHLPGLLWQQQPSPDTAGWVTVVQT